MSATNSTYYVLKDGSHFSEEFKDKIETCSQTLTTIHETSLDALEVLKGF